MGPSAGANLDSVRPRPKGEALAVLKLLAIAGGDHAPVVFTSREIGERIGVSQQAADRYLLALEAKGLLTRSMAQRRQRLLLTPAAMELLRSEYRGTRRIFEGPAKVSLSGKVTSGLGEGRSYLSQPGYVIQFTERLGYSPYPRHAQRAAGNGGPSQGFPGLGMERGADRRLSRERPDLRGGDLLSRPHERPLLPPHPSRPDPL